MITGLLMVDFSLGLESSLKLSNARISQICRGLFLLSALCDTVSFTVFFGCKAFYFVGYALFHFCLKVIFVRDVFGLRLRGSR